MNGIQNKSMEKSKLLAAVAVLALIVCVFAAFIPTDVDAVTEDEFTAGSTGYTVSGAQELILSEPVKLAQDFTIKTNNANDVLTISYSATTGSMFDLANNKLIVTGPGKVILNVGIVSDGNANNDLKAVNGNGTVEVKSGATLQISSTNGDSGRIWINTNLSVEGATVDFNGANGVTIGSGNAATVTLANNATLKFTNPNYTAGNISGTANNSKIEMIDAASSLNFYGMTLVSSNVTSDGTIGIYKGATVNVDQNSTITADQVELKTSQSVGSTTTISGEGTVNADITAGDVGDNKLTLTNVNVTGSVTAPIDDASDFTYNGADISGTVYTGIITKDISVAADATFIDVTVNPGVDVTLSGDVNTYGYFYLYGAIMGSGTVKVNSNSIFMAYGSSTIAPNVTVEAADGATKVTIDLSNATGTQYIRQDVTSDLVYSQTQTVVIEESIIIKKGASLTVKGQLIVNDGVDVIIEEGGQLTVNNQKAKVTVNGDIEIETGGDMTITNAEAVDVSGTITSDGTLTINSIVNVKDGGKILIDDGNDSTFTISGNGAKLTIDAGGNVEIRGKANVSDIINKGTVTLNGAILNGDVKISMAANGAVVDIKSFTSDSTAKPLVITDDQLVFKDSKTATEIVKVDGVKYTANTLTVDGEAYGGIRGLVISESVTSETKNKVTTYYNSFVLSGSISIADESTTASDEVKTMPVGISGPSIDVTEALTISKGVTLELTSGNLDVAGTITATADGATVEATGGDINVTGMIETCEEITANINAFSYEGTLDGEPVWYYTTLKTAIDNGQTEIEALGTTSVLESVDIPAGTQVKAGDVHDKITIGSSDARDVVVTVKDGGEFRSCVIDVMGTLTFDNKRDDRNNTITSDVYVEDDVSKSYTNIYTALNNAQSGDTVTIYRSGSNVILDKDITVKEGVILDIPSGKGVTVNDNVTVTTDGTIKLSGALVAQTAGFNPDAENHSTIAVNGALMSVTECRYTDYYIPGAYYNLVNAEGNWYYITPIEQAAAVSNDVSEGIITIWGENQVGDVEFTGDEDQPVIITVNGKLRASSIKLTWATIGVADDANNYQFDGTITSDVGSVQFVNANGFGVESAVDGEGATIMSVGGTPAQANDKGVDAEMTIVSGNVTVIDIADGNDLNVSGIDFTIAEGATLTVTGSGVKMVADKLAVNGTLVAYDGGNVTADSVYVIGTFTVSPADSDNNILAGTADIDYIRVGLSEDFKTTSAATLNAEKITDWKYIYVSAESTVTAGLIENAASTQFYVEDALWFTVYGNGNAVKADAPGIVPTENVLLDKWTGKDANDVTVTIENDAVDKSFTIGQVERFDADIDYDIYTITVFADPGITAVYIDGKLMTSGVFKNNDNMWNEGFQLTVAAGEHEITYKLGNYFSGEAKMTVNGSAVEGNTFTTSGTTTADKNVTIYLQGIEASAPETPSSGDSGMGLTDYLLIILVVLIVIMAIMVAMRLMRS